MFHAHRSRLPRRAWRIDHHWAGRRRAPTPWLRAWQGISFCGPDATIDGCAPFSWVGC